MKFNLNEKLKRSTVRTLNDFSRIMFSLLEKKAFEDITIGEICEASNYQRSTFYNYFDDIFDLMDYCWIAITEEMHIDEYEIIDQEKRTWQLFNHMYDYMMSMQEAISSILLHNESNGKLLESLKKYMKQKIKEIMLNCPEAEEFPISYEVVTEHYSNTIELILEQCFLKKKKMSKKEALVCLDFFLGTLERSK